jgi:hypothetical protein
MGTERKLVVPLSPMRSEQLANYPPLTAGLSKRTCARLQGPVTCQTTGLSLRSPITPKQFRNITATFKIFFENVTSEKKIQILFMDLGERLS